MVMKTVTNTIINTTIAIKPQAIHADAKPAEQILNNEQDKLIL
jgi:hypothetical protein